MNIPKEKLDELKQQAKEKGFSEEAVEQSLQLQYKMVSAILNDYLSYFADTVLSTQVTTCNDANIKKLIQDELNKIDKSSFIGFIELEFKDAKEMKLRMQLSLVPKDYIVDIPIPPGTAGVVTSNINRLLELVNAYYQSIKTYHNTLYNTMRSSIEQDISGFYLDKDGGTVGLDLETDKRIGVLCYYVDKEGRPFKHKRKS